MFKSINGGILPCRFTRHSAGFDVYSNEDVVIGAGETKIIGLGIALDFDAIARNIAFDRMINLEDWMKCHYFALHIRSSLRAKGLTSLGTGIIDMDYRDEIKMVIHNPVQRVEAVFNCDYVETRLDEKPDDVRVKNTKYTIKKGDKIGQLILCRHEGWLLPSEYAKDEERVGGFGSSDKENK